MNNVEYMTYKVISEYRQHQPYIPCCSIGPYSIPSVVLSDGSSSQGKDTLQRPFRLSSHFTIDCQSLSQSCCGFLIFSPPLLLLL